MFGLIVRSEELSGFNIPKELNINKNGGLIVI